MVPADVQGLEVACDDQMIDPGDFGRALPFDPGPHTVFAGAPGRNPWNQNVVLVARQTVNVAVPILPVDSSTVPRPTLVRRGGTQRTLALITGGVGLAGLAVGTAFGILAIADHHTAHQVCPLPSEGCDSTGVSDWRNAVTAGDVSTAGFIVGGVGAAAGLTLFFTAPKDTKREAGFVLRPELGFGPRSMTLRGTW
jgi:hypothetical protein